MELVKLSDYLWEIPKTGGMLVPGRVYASAKMIDELREDPALTQVANVARLPGIVGYSLAMPDIHWGYGFPIGGVAAIDADEGCHLARRGRLRHQLRRAPDPHAFSRSSYVESRIEQLVDALFRAVPAGVGSCGRIPAFDGPTSRKCWAKARNGRCANGYGDRARPRTSPKQAAAWRVPTRTA